MSYSQLDTEVVRVKFRTLLSDEPSIFDETAEIGYSDYLAETLRFNEPIALAINSEKSHSEMIIAPIVLELRLSLMKLISR